MVFRKKTLDPWDSALDGARLWVSPELLVPLHREVPAMDTFYLTLRVIPTAANPRANDIEGALALCWILDDDPRAALAKASCKVRQYGWDIVEVEDCPVVTTRDNFIERDLGLEQYDRAQEQGMAMAFIAWSKDGHSSYGPFALELSDGLVLESCLSDVARLKRKGRCLHFDAGSRCTEVIRAHSIQKNGALSLIADHGTVYALSKNFGDIKRHKGTLAFTKQGINQVSTFRGFCEKHDNELFEPIDNFPVVPTQQQILLYAYRSICKEIRAKELNVSLYERHAGQLDGGGLHEATRFGLDNLIRQKEKFDKSLRTRAFGDVRSVLFCSQQDPCLVFSGLIYPEFDFLGNALQDLSDHSALLDLLTFSFVPTEKGWGILFAWHEDSSKACVDFMKSLATVTCEGGSLGDHLFRLVVSNCDNMAIRPQWWESLTEHDRTEMARVATVQADVFAPSRHDYLMSGLTEIADWNFEKVISDMD